MPVFFYGFLAKVNQFHGRAHEGEMHIGADQNGVRLASPKLARAQYAKAFADVRPHDLDVQRYCAGINQSPGITAKQLRAIVERPLRLAFG